MDNKKQTTTTNSKKGSVINSLQGNTEIDNKNEVPKPNKSQLDSTKTLANKSAMLHTYKADVQSLVKDRKISMVRAMAIQSDKAAGITNNTPSVVVKSAPSADKHTSSMFIIIASILMLILGSTAIFVAYSARQSKLAAIADDKSSVLLDDSIIFVEYRAKLDVTDRLPRETLSELKKILDNSNTALGSITQIILQQRAWSPELGGETTYSLYQSEALELLGLSLSDRFIRLLGGDTSYMLGVHTADRNTPFILLTTRSYEHAFEAMLQWERVAETELSPLFNLEGNSSTSRTPGNVVIKNIDARVMRDESGEIRFLYSFLDESTLLITNNIHTLTEVARRYRVRKASGATI